MEPVDWARQQRLMSAELLGIESALMYVVVRGRNAWHSTWAQHYTGPSALATSLERAQAHAEDQRGPGSVFTIHEVPGLVLLSQEGPVGLVDFHSLDCFGKWDVITGGAALRLGTPIASVLRAFGPNGEWKRPAPSEDSLIAGCAPWDALSPVPSRRAFKRWVSEAVGAKYALHWNERASDYSRSAINRILKAFGELNRADERARAQNELASASRAAHQMREANREALEAINAEHEAAMSAIFGPNAKEHV